MFELARVSRGDEIAGALETQHDELTRYLGDLAMPEFFGDQGEKWSPADHARHLHKSVRPLVQALAAPRLLLWLRFGRHRGESRSYAVVRDTYRARLAKGYGAKTFAPSRRDLPGDADSWRAEIIRDWTASVRALAKATTQWNERALDRYQVPHPLLGKMSVREILFFTLYHNAHHLQLVAERRAQRTTLDMGRT